MNIAIVGYGKMGHTIEKIALERGIKVKAKIDPVADGATHRDITKEALKNVDVCIEFTTPDIALGNIKKIAALKKNIVVGTTGWYGNLEEARKTAKENGVGIIYSPNFSIGVNVFFRLIKDISKIMNNLNDYNVSMKETHHIHKKDAPSGTARKIAEIIKENMSRAGDINIESVRKGEIPGTHIVNFESYVDVIKLEHEAKGREGFAVGAVMAAEWINKKKGFYSIEDMMNELIR